MSKLSVELPDDLRAEVAKEAARQGVSESVWLEHAAREKLSDTKQLALLASRAEKGDRDAYLRVLDKVPAVAPDAGDER